MARGRASSQGAYRGALGRTTTDTVHVTGPKGELVAVTVHTAIDAASDPELAERLLSDDPERALNVVRTGEGDPIRVAVPVVYHDSAAELLVLVLGDAHRHRELDERIRLLEQLRDDDVAIPAYVKDFSVVFGASGLRAYLEQRAEQALANKREQDLLAKLEHVRRERDKDVARRDQDVARRDQDVARRDQDVARREAELARQREELARQQDDLDRMRAEARARVLAAAQQPTAEPTTIGPPPSEAVREELMTRPVAKNLIDGDEELSTGVMPVMTARGTAPPPARAESEGDTHAARKLDPAELARPVEPSRPQTAMETPSSRRINGADDDEKTRSASVIPPGADPVTTGCTDLSIGPDAWLDRAVTGQLPSFEVKRVGVRLALVPSEAFAKSLTGPLDVRVLLHRTPTYPVISLVIGTPVALRVPNRQQLAVVVLDIGVERDRAVLASLGETFELELGVGVRGRVARRARMVAPLAENVAYIVRAANDHLHGLSADGETPSFAVARDLVLGAGYDLLGTSHAEASEFREDKLTQLATASQVRRALAAARRFARPSREDYLVVARGYPLSRWRELRRQVLERAVEHGLWMGPELAQVAVSEGLARSRRELVVKLEAAFEELRRHPTAFDLDGDAADDNVKALTEEAKALGVELRRKVNGAIKSEDVATVSGSIERTPTAGVPRARSVDELVALLDDKRHRVTAAAELCDRADPRAAAHVIAAVKKMSRAEAVRILGKSVKFGAPAAPPLIEGLGSSKAFLRHGCALALALLRTDDGTQAVIQLLFDEPTEIWREVARAIGQIGPTALMPLASRAGRLGDRLAQYGERIAWAMAHLGVRGGRASLEQLAAGQSVIAPIAKQALGLFDTAARDEVRVRPDQPSRDVTVNRQFSRRFFEALETDRPDLAAQALHDLDASSPQELDESDLIVDEDEDEAELDESDLIQS